MAGGIAPLCAQLAHLAVDLSAGNRRSSVIIRCTDVQPTHGNSKHHMGHQRYPAASPHRARRARYTRCSLLPAAAPGRRVRYTRHSPLPAATLRKESMVHSPLSTSCSITTPRKESMVHAAQQSLHFPQQQQAAN